MKKFVDQLKANPIMSVLAGFILIMTTVTGTLTATGQLDDLIMTRAEHDADFIPLSEQVEENRAWNKCHRLELQLERLEDRLWERQHAETVDDDIIREIQRAIERAERDFEALNCAEVLAT